MTSKTTRRLAYVAAAALVAGCVNLLSETEVEIEAERSFQQMRTQIPVSRDASTKAYVTCVARSIIDELGEPYGSRIWEVELFDHEAANAFAMPGQKIGVFTGILKVANTPDMLAAVLGHEVAHVTEKHAIDRANRAMQTQMGVAIAAGAVGGSYATQQTTAALLGIGAQLGLALPFGRSQESEADTVGLDFMAAAGFDPRASIELWKNMQKDEKDAPPEFLSTHPSSKTRISDLVAQLPAALVKYNTAREAGKRPRCR